MPTPKRKTPLRAVSADERKPPRPKTVAEAAEVGTPIEELMAIRAVLSRAIDSPNTSPRDLAALTRRQLEVSREIRALEAQAEEEAEADGGTDDEEWSEEAI